MFNAQIAADTDAETLYRTIFAVAKTADEFELLLLPSFRERQAKETRSFHSPRQFRSSANTCMNAGRADPTGI